MSGDADPGASDAAKGPRRRKRITATIVAGVAVGMVGMSFAAVPLYQMFCQLTGFGGTTQRADAAPDHVLDRIVTVQFDANMASDLGWEFQPDRRSVQVRLGDVAQIAYRAHNPSDQTTYGSASFNVTPEVVGAYFTKITCFCFNEQTLAAGEVAEMPVIFFVDPALADDRTLDYVNTITLSYTFFKADPPAGPVAPSAPGGGA